MPAPYPWKEPHALFKRSIGGSEWDWTQSESLLTAIIHLFSFSKSFAIPGHRLGGIACSSHLLESQGPLGRRFGPISKLLDNMQVCPPRADTQRAVAWALSDPENRKWRLGMSNAVWSRLELFGRVLVEPVPDGATSAAEQGWHLESKGGYYAFVRHPFSVDSTMVAHALAVLCGAVSMPSTCFVPNNAGKIVPSLRFSVANVSDELIRELPQRLVWLSMLWRTHGEGWGID